VVLLAVLWAAAVAQPDFPNPLLVPLRELARRRGLLIGAASSYDHLINKSDSTYALLLAQQYSSTTELHSCRWDVVHPSATKFNFGECDFAVHYASQFNMSFRYTTLVSGDNNPQWLNSLSAPQLRSTLTQHISVVVSRYRKQIAFINVVSNAMSDDGSGLKNAGPWYPKIPDYINLAFQTAYTADQSVKLFYNDYGGESMSPKADAIYNLLSGMVKNGIPVHGVGLEMHLSVDNPPDPHGMRRNIDRLNQLGLDVHITEMDVSCDPCDDDRRLVQDRIYREVLGTCLASMRCSCFETWGFTDRYPPAFPDRQRAAVNALPWDANYQPKSIVDAMEHELWHGPD